MPTTTAPLPSLQTPPRSRLLLFVRSVASVPRLHTRAVRVGRREGEPAWQLYLRWALACLVEIAVRIVSPRTCAACDARLSESDTRLSESDAWLSESDARLTIFCDACHATCAEVATTKETVAGGSYTGALAIAVKRLKYSSRPDLARPLGAWLSERACTAGLTADLVVPVPLHPRKLRDRGYNQSALIASHVATALGARFAPRALLRVRDTAPQASLDKEDRKGNIAGAFAARQKEAIRGKRILLIDDVATTGATLKACVDALMSAGAESVTPLVLARKDLSR